MKYKRHQVEESNKAIMRVGATQHVRFFYE